MRFSSSRRAFNIRMRFVDQPLQGSTIEGWQVADHCLITAIPGINEAAIFLVPAPGCHDDGIAVLDIGIDAKCFEAVQLPEIEASIAVLEVPAAAGAHFAGRIAEPLHNLLAGELVVGIQYDQSGTAQLGTAQARHVDDIGVRFLLGPLGNDFQPGCEPPCSIALRIGCLPRAGTTAKPARRITGACVANTDPSGILVCDMIPTPAFSG